MYFRKIADRLRLTYFATDSAGSFVAAITKEEADNENSWMVALGSEQDEKVVARGLTMEAAFDEVELQSHSYASQHAHLTKSAK